MAPRSHTTQIDALLDATKDWKPHAGKKYDEMRLRAQQMIDKKVRVANKGRPRWYQIWRWFENPCALVDCCDTGEGYDEGHGETRHLFLVSALFSVVIGIALAFIWAGEGLTIKHKIVGCLPVILTLYVLVLGRRLFFWDWDVHEPEFARLRSGLGHSQMLIAYMTDELAKSRDALIGEKGAQPFRVVQRALAKRLEEVRALTARLAAAGSREKDERLLVVLRDGIREAAEIEAAVASAKDALDERIAQTAAFFDECSANILALDASIRVMAMRSELALHRAGAEGEIARAEQAFDDALFSLQSKWTAFQQVADTLLPQAVAATFGQTAGSGDEKQNLEILEAAMGRVFDALPPLERIVS